MFYMILPLVPITLDGRLNGHHRCIAEGTVEVPLETVAGEPTRNPAWLLDRFDPENWFGLDGRPARVVFIR